MQKKIFILLAVLAVLSLVGCGNHNQAKTGAEQETTLPEQTEAASTENAGAVMPSESVNGNGESVIETESDDDMPKDRSFNFETKTVMLNSGYEMPIYGIGTYSLLDEVCVDAVSAALERGVRLIDTAYMYHNEESVGEAVRNSGIPREEIFVTTKLYPNQFAEPEAAIEEALDKLDIQYIEFCVLHGKT